MFSKQLESHCSQCLAIKFVSVPTGELLGRCKHSFLATRVSHKRRHFASDRESTTPPTLHAFLWEKHPKIFYQEHFFLFAFQLHLNFLFEKVSLFDNINILSNVLTLLNVCFFFSLRFSRNSLKRTFANKLEIPVSSFKYRRSYVGRQK